MSTRRLVICIIFFFTSVGIVTGQEEADTTLTTRIETLEGNIFTGIIIQKDSISVLLRTTDYGDIRIPEKIIKAETALRYVTKVGDQIWLPNPQSARYYWAPNGYSLEKGSAYYQNIWVFYNQVSFAPCNNFSIGAGLLPLFLFGGAPTPVFIVPKFSIPVVKDKVNIGTGAFLGAILGEDAFSFGLLYETTTIGSRDKNVSIGFAWGFGSEGSMDRPVINFSTMLRTGPRGYFISENYFFPIEDENIILISFGGRSLIRNISLDYSLWLPFVPDMEEFVAIPYLGFAIPIGRKGIK